MAARGAPHLRASDLSLERVAPDVIEIIARTCSNALAPAGLCSLRSTCTLMREQLEALAAEVRDLRADARLLWGKFGGRLPVAEETEAALECTSRGIGDNDVAVLSKLLACGALRNLELLGLDGNQIGDVGLAALANALSNGALANLIVLDLGDNQIGDAGVSALASACANGALTQLKTLDLRRNQIGDPGITSLSEALAVGAMHSLHRLYVGDGPLGREHLALKAACEACGIVLQ